MNASVAEPPPPAGQSWSRRRWIFLVAVIFAAQIALLFVFGEKKFPPVRTVAKVPQLRLADPANELVALNDPTLFALPHANDFASAVWQQPLTNPPPAFGYTEPPQFLLLAADQLGVAFRDFMQTNPFVARPLDFKTEPPTASPVMPVATALPQNSTLQIFGELAHRRLLHSPVLPSLAWNDVIAASKVRVVVDADGNVASAILLPSDNLLEAAGRAEIGDTNALALARTLRFTPAERLAFGELIFNWHTVPVATTNAP